MIEATEAQLIPSPAAGHIGRIPVRNLWLLMLYASDLARFYGRSDSLFVDDSGDLPDLIGRLLAAAVERRLRRGLSSGYSHRNAILNRVRGRIDLLETATAQLQQRGQIACEFEELTLNTTRNRLMRAALEHLTRLVADPCLSEKCRSLAVTLSRLGVSGVRPSRGEISGDQISGAQSDDRQVVALARLAFDLALPTEEAGPTASTSPHREEAWVRRLYERAVAGFYTVELVPSGWKVNPGKRLRWHDIGSSPGVSEILPIMVTDLTLEHPATRRRVIIDTKFTSIMSEGRFRETLKSGYIYQLYAYLRSQEGTDELSDAAEGLLLHPSVGQNVDEWICVQGHKIRFTTIDLAKSPADIRASLRNLVMTCDR